MAETSTRVAMRRLCSRINADDFMKGFAIEARFDAGRNACSDNAAEMDGLCGSDCSLYCGTTTARRNCGLDCRLSLGFQSHCRFSEKPRRCSGRGGRDIGRRSGATPLWPGLSRLKSSDIARGAIGTMGSAERCERLVEQ